MSVHDRHLSYLQQALSEARKSPPKPSNFRVGCLIISCQQPDDPRILSTGYTLELPGNTHAEQSALLKLAALNSTDESGLPRVLTPELNINLYTTLEPCGKRLSGNAPCVQRIIATRHNNPEGGIRKVIFGAKEPGTFVQDSQSCALLTQAGIEWEYIPTIEKEILEVAMEGHENKGDAKPARQGVSQTSSDHTQTQGQAQHQGTNVDDISAEERKRQEEQPRNPKKRMMEI